MKNLLYIALSFLSISLFTSCQKVVDIDLNDSDSRIVVDANFAMDSVCKVELTQTVNFDETNNFPAVSGAQVRLTDDAGNSELLTEMPGVKGYYTSSVMKGVAGRTYTLEITADSKTYTSVEKMANPIPIDSINLRKGLFRDALNIHAYFTDPAGIENFYRIVYYINDTTRERINVTEDLLRDGEHFDAMLFVGDDDSLVNGDSITVYLRNIDKGSYKFFTTLFQAEGGGDPGATPANPVSNFTNGALGYFCVYAETRKTLIVNQ